MKENSNIKEDTAETKVTHFTFFVQSRGFLTRAWFRVVLVHVVMSLSLN